MIIEEAKRGEKLCPMKLSNGLCQGSSCMAWRWKKVNVVTEAQTLDPFGRVKFVPFAETKLSTTHGYCGLAGAP